MKRFLLSFACLAASVGAGTSGQTASSERPRVLYLGDSLSIGAFGQSFDTAMRSAGFQVHTVVAGGASPYYWLKNYQSLPCTIGFWEKSDENERRTGYVRAVPKMEDLIAATKPDVVVVQTGINLYATLRSKRRPREENVKEVKSLIDQMCRAISDGGARSYWVLPPHSHEERYAKDLQDELSALMREVAYRYDGTVFESAKVTRYTDPYPANDGIHYGPTEARQWAEKVSEHFGESMRFLAASPGRRMVAASAAAPVRSEEPAHPATPPRATPVAVASDEGTSEMPAEVVLRVRLEEKSVLESAADLDYANALGLYEYEVLNDLRGNYPLRRIRIAHGIVFGRKLTSAAKAEIGSEAEWVLVPLSKYNNLSSWQMIDDLRPNFEIPIYTPKLD